MIRRGGFAGFVIATVAGSAALPSTGADWYAGAWAGSSRSQVSALAEGVPGDSPPPAPAPITVLSASQDEQRGAWRIMLGRRLTPQVSVEAHYSDLGAGTFHYWGQYAHPGSPATHPTVEHQVRRGSTAWGADLVASAQVAPGWEVFAGLGAAVVEVGLVDDFTRVALGTTSGSTRVRSRSTVARGLAGVAWSPAPAWNVRLAFDYQGKAGEPFQASPSERHTGESSQASVWLGLFRRF